MSRDVMLEQHVAFVRAAADIMDDKRVACDAQSL